MKKSSLVFVIFLFSINCSFANAHKADSLKAILARAKPDTTKVNLYILLAAQFENTNPDTSLILSNQALALARNISWKKGIINAMYDVGLYHELKGEIATALVYEDSALIFCDTYGINSKLASIYNVLGNITSEQDRYSAGLDYYFKALAIDSIYHKNVVPDLYNNIGLNYEEEGNFAKAEEYYFKAIKIYQELNNMDGIATTEDNLANIYDLEGNYTKGLSSHFKTLHYDSTLGKQNNMALDYSNIGNCYMSMGNYSKSIEYTFRSIALNKKIGILGDIPSTLANAGTIFIESYERDTNNKGLEYIRENKKLFVPHSALLDSALVYELSSLTIAKATNTKMTLIYAYRGLGDIYSLRKDYSHAVNYLQQAYNMADSLGTLKEKMEIAKLLGHAFAQSGKYELASQYLDKTLALKDSLFSNEKEKELGKMEAKYEDDKRFIEQQKEIAITEEQDKRQKMAIAGISGGLGLVLIFLLLLFRRFKVTNRQKKVIEQQKKDVDAAYGQLNNAHAQLQEKDKDITDSIAYARKIQSAILPPEESLKDSLGESFVLYKPRDVVSGDFYWCHEEGDKTIFAVVDCTGHGVPGAFMSMIGNSILNQVVIENKVTNDPAEILNQVRSNLLKQLQQKGQDSVSRDGMDMAICIWNRKKNTLQYSGANNPLYIVRKGICNFLVSNPKFRPHGSDMLEILPDKQPIGYQEGKMETVFTSQIIELKKGDSIYIASDGYHDQFGGERNKKFTSKAFRDLLVSVYDKPVAEQKKILDTTIEKWKDNYAQTDDICVMGINIS